MSGPGHEISRMAIIGEQLFRDRAGGLNRYAAALHSTMRDAGIDAHRFVLGTATPESESLTPQTHLVGSPAGSRFDRSRAMDLAVRAHQPFDLIDVHFAAYAGMLRARRSLRSALWVVHFQGPWASESVAEGATRGVVLSRRYLERWVYHQPAAAIVLSESFGTILADRYGVSPERISVIPPGVDLHRFAPRDRSLVRKKLNIGADAFVVLCARRLVHRMGLPILVEAVRSLGHRPDLQVVIVGDGPLRGQLTEQVADMGSTFRIEGRVDDDRLVDWYSAADLQVVPSIELEGFGLTALEGLACGLPALVSDLGGMSELVHSIDPNLVIPPGDMSALRERLDAALRGSLVLPSRAECRVHAQPYDWASVGERHLALYRTLERGGAA
jgi:glycosyltransferase involved in cell wall biosynthesis